MKKRVVSALSAVVLILSSFTCAVIASASAIKYGDVDGDDEISIIDVTLIQRHLIDAVKLDDDAQERGMVSGNDELSIIDATLIQRCAYRGAHAGTYTSTDTGGYSD